MRKTSKKPLAFTRLRKFPEASHLQNSPPQASPSWKLYRRLTDIPLDRLITCFCDDDLSALVIAGDPALDELQAAWELIREDFEDRMKSSTQTEIQHLVRDINLYQTQYNCVKTICDLLAYFPVITLVNELMPILTEMLGFPIELDPADKKAFAQGLECAMGHATRYLTEAMTMAAQLPPDPDAGKKKVRIGHEYFDEVIVALSRYNKYKISKRDTTGSEFCALVQDMNRGLEAARKIQDN